MLKRLLAISRVANNCLGRASSFWIRSVVGLPFCKLSNSPDFIEKNATSLAEIRADPKRRMNIPIREKKPSTGPKVAAWSMIVGNGSAGSEGGMSKIQD
jgi:hypothetical protein